MCINVKFVEQVLLDGCCNAQCTFIHTTGFVGSVSFKIESHPILKNNNNNVTLRYLCVCFAYTDICRENVCDMDATQNTRQPNKNGNIPINGRQILYFDLFI